MEVKLGSGSILIAIILGIGYVVMFVSIIMESSSHLQSSDIGSDVHIESQLEYFKKEALVMEKKLVDLASKLAIKGTDTISSQVAISPKKTADSKAHRPGVIILGMHRSGW
jgi:alanine racemase